jgi:hypothetical protein
MWPENLLLALFERAINKPSTGMSACNVFRLAEKEAVGSDCVKAFAQTITTREQEISLGAKAH